MVDEPVGLAAAIRRLRTELSEARVEGEGEDLRFRLGQVELEFAIEVTREGSGEAGIKFWVVSLGGRAGVSDARTHRVTLSLVPQVRVGDRWEDALVGQEVARRPPSPGPVSP
jgi:hypothetical protein